MKDQNGPPLFKKFSFPTFSFNKTLIFKNSFWQYLEKGIRLIAGVIIFGRMADYLGVEDFGLYSYILAVLSLFSPLIFLGMPLVFKKKILEKKEKEERYLGTVFWSTGVMAIVSSFALFGVMSFFEESLLSKKLFLISSFVFFARVLEIFDHWFDSQVLSKYGSLAKIFSLCVVATLRLWGIVSGKDLAFFVYLYILEYSLLGLGLLFFYVQRKGLSFIRFFEKNLLLEMLKESWPLVLSSFSVLIYMKIDQVMLNSYLGKNAVGLYATAVKISETFYFVPMALMTSVFPILIKKKKESFGTFINAYQRYFSLMSFLAFGFIVGVYFFGAWGLEFIFGKKYVDSFPILSCHIWTFPFVFWGTAQSIWDIAYNLTLFSLIRNLTGAIINIIANIILIQKIGVLGAAYATILSYFVTHVGMNLFHPQTRKIVKLQLRSLILSRSFE